MKDEVDRLRGLGLEPPLGPLGSFVEAFLAFWKVFCRFLYDAKGTFVYHYRRARRRPRELKATVPLSDSMAADAVATGTKLEQDEAAIVLYRTQSGSLLTPQMIERGEHITTEPISVAVECSDERAEELVQYLEGVSFDRDLDENERLVMSVLKAKLAARWV